MAYKASVKKPVTKKSTSPRPKDDVPVVEAEVPKQGLSIDDLIGGPEEKLSNNPIIE